MEKITHLLRTQAQENGETGKLGSKGIRKTLGRLTGKSRSKRAGCIRIGSVALTSCVWLAYGNYAVAQIMPDTTWGAEQSVVEKGGIDGAIVDLITQGATRGANRFHSFEQFDITEGESVYFDSPQGIENIFSRVRGNDASYILGTLGVNGGANLFFINPNGIIFGESAKLHVEGSFVATTANGIQFGERGFFSTTQSEVPSPLLTVNPSAFLFNQITPGRIESRSVAFSGVDPFGFPFFGLRVPDGKSLLLVGGEILIDGQMFELEEEIFGGGLNALEGRVELAAVAGSGTVGLTVDGNSLSLNVPPEILRADIELTNGALVITSSEAGGDIQVWGKEITLTDFSTISSSSFGAGKSGTIVVNASELVQASGVNSGFFTTGEATGDGGEVMITTPVLQLWDGAQIATATFGAGNAGNVVVNASELVQVSDNIDKVASGLRTDTFGEGDAGDLTINTPVLLIENGAVIASGTSSNSTGNGGTLTVNASTLVQLSSEEGQLPSLLTTQTEGQGNGGNLTINTPKLVVTDGSQVSAETFDSGIGGLIAVNANTVEVTRGGQLRTTTEGSNNAGNISLQVEESVTITGDDSGFFANTTKYSSGNGGSIFIDPPIVVIQDGAEIATESKGTGEAGDIEIQANFLSLDTNARISAETATNNGGDITLLIDDILLLRRGSRISATAGTAGQAEPRGDGGNITIESDFIVAVPNENSDITADSFSGEGGRIRLKTQGLFNLVIRSREELETLLEPDDPLELKAAELQSNDITAISQTVPQLSQIPTLILLGLDPAQGLVELPAELVDVTRLIEQSLCAAAQGSEFIITGRGGLPKPPNQVLDADATWEDWRITTVGESTEVQQSNQNSYQEVTENKPNKFVEAQGWFKDANGTIILTAEPTVVTPHATGLPSFTCQ
ncbi:MAG: S-layer family protein [Coleofasciculus sp. G1-WW12-02]|uniref:two-partner secretion domain-containing protein n=1 Tax=Coleofasciculus sp. G1-WW12-02 TaxID=3068483 RepID=UPI0032F6E525